MLRSKKIASKGWITGNERGAGMPAATQAVYDGEEVTMQAGYNTATLLAQQRDLKLMMS
jgi:hypothetical protein